LDSSRNFLATISIARVWLLDNLDRGRFLPTLPYPSIIFLELLPPDKRAFGEGTGTALGYLDPVLLLCLGGIFTSSRILFT